MAGDTTVNFNLLHRTCKLVVLLCLLHISVTVVFYVRSLDIRLGFVENQQAHNNVTQPNPIKNPEATSQTEPEEKTEEPAKKLEKCPVTSPLLGKSV